MSPMKEKEAFRNRLTRLPGDAGIGAASPTHVAREFNRRYMDRPVTIQAVRKGQYEDMEGNASRILLDDDEDAMLVSRPEEKAQKDTSPPGPGDKPPASPS